MPKLTKKELLNLYRIYSNGRFISSLEPRQMVSVTACYYAGDEEMLAKTMKKILSLGQRKKRK